MKKLLYISFLVLACHYGFTQGLGNSNGAIVTVGAGAHLVTTGNGMLINSGASVITNNGTITIASDFQNNGTATVSNNGTINVAGNWDNNAANNVFTNRDKVGSTILNGTATQTVSGNTNFENLTINNSAAGSAISLSDNQTVENTITLTDGVVTTGANSLIVNSTVGSVVQGNSNASFVNGNLRKHVGYSNCLDFAGAASGGNDYVSITDNGTLDLQNNFTIEAWIYNTDASNNTIIDKGNYNYLFQTHSNGNTGLGMYNNVMGWKYSAGVVPSNTWSHVAVTFDLPNDQLKFYLNGTLLSTHTGISNPTLDNAEINIGRQSPSTCACNYFDGKIDELRVWSVTRTQTEIQQTMYGLLNGNESGLKAYYQFENGTGSGTLTDVSGNGNTGTLTNMDNANDWVSNTKHNTFSIPVGNGTATTNYYLTDMEVTSLSPGTFTYLDTKFEALAIGGTLAVTEETSTYVSVASEGEWHLVANNAPTAIKYNLKAYTANIAGLEDNKFTVLKRADGSADAADWSCTPCGISVAPADGVNANGGAGRMVADGYALRRGFSSFSKVTVAKTEFPLPIELISFDAKLVNKQVNLNWLTAHETNSDYFIIERSKNQKVWESITKVKAAGNSSSVLNYESLDANPYMGTSYYRLKEVDFDGSIFESNPEAIHILEEGELVIYPNPNNGQFYIAQADLNYNYIKVTDLAGRVVFSKPLSNITESIALNEAAGVYFVELQNENSSKVLRLIIN